MTSVAFMRLQKIKSEKKLRDAAFHNKRDFDVRSNPAIQSHLVGLNYCLAGASRAADVMETFRQRLAIAGWGKGPGLRRQRSDGVRAIEFVFSLPKGAFREERPYFAACLGWVADGFGGLVNIMSADVHLDEGAPHMHVLVLPLVGNRLVGSDLVGGPSKLRALQQSFRKRVAEPFGFDGVEVGRHDDDRRQRLLGALATWYQGRFDDEEWGVIERLTLRYPTVFYKLLRPFIDHAPNRRRPSLSMPPNARSQCSVGFREAGRTLSSTVRDPRGVEPVLMLDAGAEAGLNFPKNFEIKGAAD
ncbi:MAG: plasmid recombination protein [Pigmentiphaga sp.]|uniref:plasmid recombination protein n=1 Tax=Pigmentiphaga sp. TaxID=1977564 RepID=UPI0029B3E771|nr:plasmid recombination protein [Pigmentiphaga sp.]MDX3908023.1 plasmid recombination protein [Pigmentiphaga sp.]